MARSSIRRIPVTTVRDSFTYKDWDGYSYSNTATVLLSVYGSPVANADHYTIYENAPLTVAAPGVLTNDQDPNGFRLAASTTSTPLNGTLTFNEPVLHLYAES